MRPIVLVVDDEFGARAAFEEVLRPVYDVVTAASGPEAIAYLASVRVEAVVLDILMPGMDGLEVLARIKARDPGVEVVLVSALSDSPVVVKGMKFGAFDYVTKPFLNEQLLEVMARAVAARRTDPGIVLLVGPTTATLASVAVFLSRHLTVATAGAQILPTAGGTTPLIVVHERVNDPGGADLVARLHERFAASKITELGNREGLDQVLTRLAALTPQLDRLRDVGLQFSPDLLALINFIIQSYRESLSAGDLACAVGLSVHRLAHVVRDRLGISLMEYVTAFRYEVARHLLTVSDVVVEGIAEESGFSSASHLSRVFLERAGLRPGEYRRQVHQNGGWSPRRVGARRSAGPSRIDTEIYELPDPAREVLREVIRKKLRRSELPLTLPPPLTAGGRSLPRVRSGVSEGTFCAGCDEPIKQGDLMCDYTYPAGRVFAFHLDCACLWDEERQRLDGQWP